MEEWEGGAAHSEAREGEGGKSVPGMGRWDRRWEISLDRETEDLTWGYKMPQGQLLILQIGLVPRRGVQ